MVAERPLRADARRNRDRVLAAARAAFAESGVAVPLDEIAARAGVGPGTVYRHFPSKEALFEAVALARLQDLVDDARSRCDAPDPGAALAGFLERIADEAVAKRDLPEALAGLGSAAVAAAAVEMHDALGVLLGNAQRVGAVRADVGAADLVALLKGLVHAVIQNDDPRAARRVLAVVTDGLHLRVDPDIRLSTDPPAATIT